MQISQLSPQKWLLLLVWCHSDLVYRKPVRTSFQAFISHHSDTMQHKGFTIVEN